jgi:hypothetical protein
MHISIINEHHMQYKNKTMNGILMRDYMTQKEVNPSELRREFILNNNYFANKIFHDTLITMCVSYVFKIAPSIKLHIMTKFKLCRMCNIGFIQH